MCAHVIRGFPRSSHGEFGFIGRATTNGSVWIRHSWSGEEQRKCHGFNGQDLPSISTHVAVRHHFAVVRTDKALVENATTYG